MTPANPTSLRVWILAKLGPTEIPCFASLNILQLVFSPPLLWWFHSWGQAGCHCVPLNACLSGHLAWSSSMIEECDPQM